jgi:hypothetical protein
MLNTLEQGGIYKLPFSDADLSDETYRPALAITAPDKTGDVLFVS